MQSSTRDLGCCEMWFDATCAYSDHALVTTDLRAALTQRVLKASHRASHWKRKATDSWMNDASGVWAQWNETFLAGVIQDTDAWGKWKQTFDDEATTWVGRIKRRKERHYVGGSSPELRQLVKERNHLRRQGMDTTKLKREIRKVKRRLDRVIKKSREKEIQRKEKEDPKQMWRMFHRMMGKEKAVIPDKITFKGQAVEGEERYRAWMEMFQNNTQQVVARDVESWVISKLKANWSNTYQQGDDSLDAPITQDEVAWAVRRAKSGKAAGVDGIPIELVKQGSDHMKSALWRVFWSVYQTECVPLEWAQGMIVPIPKNSDTSKMENFRGITLLSVVGKMFVSILNRRLTRWLSEQKVLVDEQAGFREGYGTADQVFILSELIQRQRRKKKKWILAFLDIKRAYDVVWRDLLWEEMWKVGIRGKMWRVLQNLYQGTESCVAVDGKQTPWMKSEVGLRQGCVMSPTIFSIFINRLAEDLKQTGKGVKWNDRRFNLLLFADDIVLIAQDEGDMQRMLDMAYECSQSMRFQFNAQKCKVMRSGKECTKWTMGGEVIQEVQSFTYLGVEFGRRVGWKEMKKKVLEKATKRMCKIEMLRRVYGLSMTRTMQIWRTIGRPVLEYGAEVWIERDWKQAETKVVGMGRRLLNGRRTLNAEVVRGELGLETLESRWNGARLRFWRKLLEGANPLATWVYNKRREEFVLKGKKDKGNWCWRTWDILKKLGMEEVWISEYTGRIGEWRRRCAEKIDQSERAGWRREQSTQYVCKGEG